MTWVKKINKNNPKNKRNSQFHSLLLGISKAFANRIVFFIARRLSFLSVPCEDHVGRSLSNNRQQVIFGESFKMTVIWLGGDVPGHLFFFFSENCYFFTMTSCSGEVLLRDFFASSCLRWECWAFEEGGQTLCSCFVGGSMVIKQLGKLGACRILKNVKYVHSHKWTCQTIPSVSLVCTGWTLHLHTRL